MVEAVGLGDPDPVADGDPADEEALEPEPTLARSASPEPLATAPSALEQARHSLAHMPFAKWCPICIKARAADAPHVVHRDQVGPEVVQFDYSFLDTVPILIGATRRTGY
eukprot:8804-Heterocapsa_arctica.AAC.1